MTAVPKRLIAVAFSMLVASGLAVAMKPTQRIADERPRLNLETLVPKDIGKWRVDTSVAPVQVSPDVQAKLDEIYNQTLSRTYVKFNGERVMLAVAYGGDQSDAMQVHKPEVCYTAQGFGIIKVTAAQIGTRFGTLPVKRLVAVQGARIEPITYWITVGDRATVSGTDQKLAQLAYGLTGRVPDGVLVRVSSIDRDETRAYRLQEEFLLELLDSMNADDRSRIAGRLAR